MKSEFVSIWGTDVYDPIEQAALLEKLKAEVRYELIAKDILKVLSGNPSGLTKMELQSKVRYRKQRFNQTLKKLLELEKVFRSPIGKKSTPYRYRLFHWNDQIYHRGENG